jgi:hypothetical protein
MSGSSGDSIDNIDRPRGIFTQEDREYLAGTLDRELNPNARAQRMYRIRQRVRNSILDFMILVNHVEETRPALHRLLERREDDQIDRAIMALSEYLYRVLTPPEEPSEHSLSASLWQVGFIHGIIIEQALQGVSVRPRVEIDVSVEDRLPLETVKSAFEKNESMTRQELLGLLVTDEITYEQYQEGMDRRFEPIEEEAMHPEERRRRDRLNAENSTDL